jgi:hypothetical protein
MGSAPFPEGHLNGRLAMKAVKVMLGLVVVFVVAAVVRAEKEDKVVTLKGTMCCGKCCLKECEKCTNAIVVKDGDKEVTYFLDDKGGKEKYHKAICTEKKQGSVKGVVSEKDGKKWIKPVDDGVKIED